MGDGGKGGKGGGQLSQILNKNEKVPCTFSSSKITKLLNTAGALLIFGWRKKKSSILSKVLLFNIIIYLVIKLFL